MSRPFKRPHGSPAVAPSHVLPPLLLALVLAAGCVAPEACGTLDRFEGDAPGFFEALHAVPSEVEDVGPEPGHRLPALEEQFPHSTLRSIRHADPGGTGRAAVHFGGPGTPARIEVTVPRDDDRPGPPFDALWGALDFEDDQDAVRASLFSARAEADGLVRYQADVAPRAAVAEHLERLGGVAAADETVPGRGLVRLDWADWSYDVSVMVHDWRPRDGPVVRVDALPHGPMAVLVPSGLGWTPADAEAWLHGQGTRHGLPVGGVGLTRGPAESSCP